MIRVMSFVRESWWIRSQTLTFLMTVLLWAVCPPGAKSQSYLLGDVLASQCALKPPDIDTPATWQSRQGEHWICDKTVPHDVRQAFFVLSWDNGQYSAIPHDIRRNLWRSRLTTEVMAVDPKKDHATHSHNIDDTLVCSTKVACNIVTSGKSSITTARPEIETKQVKDKKPGLKDV
jgi:hypothetical protein